jgi:hypothetical protein
MESSDRDRYVSKGICDDRAVFFVGNEGESCLGLLVRGSVQGKVAGCIGCVGVDAVHES